LLGFVLLVMTLWLAGLGLWLFGGRLRRNSEVARMRARLAPEGGTAEAARERRGPMLIEADAPEQGKYVRRLLERLRLIERLRLLFEQAGLKWNVARTAHVSLALFLSAFTGVWYLAPRFRPLAPAAGLAWGILPLLYALRARASRLRKFEEQFPESLEFLGRSMRAGHAFSVSLEMIHTEFQEPLAGEFRRAFDEQNLGMPLDTALERMAARVPSMDVHFFVSAVLLQKRTGGNLAEVLDKLAYLIRERFKLRGRIRAVSAHGKMTGSVLSAIPAAVGGIMCYVNPEFATFFVNDQTGQWMLGGAIALQLLGYGVIKKIVSIEV
jgi:tight adherence protein B